MLYSTDKKCPLISTVYKQSSPGLVVSQVYWAKLTMAPQAVFGVASLQVTKPVPHFVHFPLFSVHPGQDSWNGGFFFFFFLTWPACKAPEAVPSFLFSAAAPRQQEKLGHAEAERKCLIRIVWPGFCCIPQIVYVSCSAPPSWCYFIPDVSKRMTRNDSCVAN